MIRVIAWAIWVELLVAVIFITFFKLPYSFTMSEGQMYIQSIRSSGKTNNARRSYAYGTVIGWDKPVHLSIPGLMRDTDKLGNEEEFKAKYVNTGIPLDVFLGKMWMVPYDVARINLKDESYPKYSFTGWLVVDVVLIFVCILIYVFLTKRRRNAVDEIDN